MAYVVQLSGFAVTIGAFNNGVCILLLGYLCNGTKVQTCEELMKGKFYHIETVCYGALNAGATPLTVVTSANVQYKSLHAFLRTCATAQWLIGQACALARHKQPRMCPT
eukprot:173463-Pelagomonas_calceolata.AAC.3